MQDAAMPLTMADIDADFCADYRCPPNAFDEMCVNDDQIRIHWQYLLQALKTLGREELDGRSQEARRILRDNGVTHNLLGEEERPWQLDPIPLLISSEEWASTEKGLMQRAELMHLLLADLYGKQTVLRKGILPIEIIATHPGYLRSCVNTDLGGHPYLTLYAVDLVRAPNGSIWAIADRTQAPSGMGYALENRLVMSRILPSLFRDSHVHRLSLFYRNLRHQLAAMTTREDHRIVLLSPGMGTDTYFEHAYLAKYLGYTLVEGEDLTVRDGRVCLKTLDGLQNVDVILRRVNDYFCDPLEFRPDSRYGVAGLNQAVRMGHVTMANALGSSILENPGIFAFLPKLARYFLDEELTITSPDTWWCGTPQGQDYVLANLDKLVIKHIYQRDKQAKRGNSLSAKEQTEIKQKILKHPHLYVGTEEIPRSTTPVFLNGRLEPRQMVLRSFLVNMRGEEWTVMPGGLTRVFNHNDSPLISSHSSGLSKDTWVLASEPEKQFSLLASEKQSMVIFEGDSELPSRVAENLFWLGRYAERAEGTVRLLRTVISHFTDPYNFLETQDHSCLHSLLAAVTSLTDTYPGFIGEGAEQKLTMPETELFSVFSDRNRLGSLSSTLQFLINAAKSVRDRLSPDMWRIISDIDDEFQKLQHREKRLQMSQMINELDKLVAVLAAFSGLSNENMTHGQAWRFMMIGRRLERAWQTTHLLLTTLSTSISDEAVLLESLLTITDNLLSYRRRYRTQVQTNATLELILQNENNPRSIGYQLACIEKHIHHLPHKDDMPYRSQEERLILTAVTKIRLADVNQLAGTEKENPTERQTLIELLEQLNHLLPTLSDALTNSYFSHAEKAQQLVNLATELDREV